MIIAIMITTIVVALSVKASWTFEMGMSRSANGWLMVQQETSLTALEDAARYFLEEDLNNAESVNDNLEEINFLSSLLQFEPTDGIFLSGIVEDAHARFNINSLQQKVTEVQPGAPASASFTTSQKRFIRLLQTIPVEDDVFLEEFEATAITEAVIDWLDADNTPTGFNGAESDYYSGLDPSITIANRKMLSVSELLVVKGMTPVLYRGLLPNIIALQEETAINVNTMQPQLIRVFNSPDILQPQPLKAVEDYIFDRGTVGFEEIGDFSEAPSIAAMVGANESGGSNIDTALLSVKSAYFLLFGQVELGDHIGRSRVLLRRDEQGVKVLRRTDANF